MKIKTVLYIFILLSFIGCEEEFNLSSDKNENVLVVDGLITDKPGPYIVTLSHSSPIGDPSFIPYVDCKVEIINDKGNSEILKELNPGHYSTAKNGMLGIIGNKYKLSIITSSGVTYATDFQKMKDKVLIDTITADLKYIRDINFPYGKPGYQFYLDTKIAPTSNNYFLWTLNETYEYDIDYKLAFVQNILGDIIYFDPKYDTLSTCWKTEKVKKIFTNKTENLSSSQILGQALHFVSTESKKLTKRYSVLVNQYLLTEESYNYWSNIENQMSNEDFFSSRQPYNIRGNIRNINDNNEIVLGNFTVASLDQKRIFVDRPRAPFYYTKCVVILNPESIRDYKKTHDPPYFYVEVNEVNGLIKERCIDCRSEGGKLNKPVFWNDIN
ncbi:MAG: DUF4249 domain-containing protein [Chlorobi bacterium]|nr:DUF4249 domain-containing protein [Chlorobiota bacterium]